MKQKGVSLLLALLMMFSLLPVTALAEDSVSGSCGTNVTWTLTGSGTLTISGTGNMDTRYSWGKWSDAYTNLVKKVVINRGVNSIANSAFYECKNLSSVTIPSGVTSIGWYAFMGCTSLSSISIPSTVETIGNSAFSECSKLSKVTIANGVSEIESSVFSGCTSLKTISLPSSITKMESNVFSGCKNLTSVTLPSRISVISYEMFKDCTSLRSLKIPDSVTEIGPYAFKGCTNLSALTLPSSVNSLDDMAFEYCTNLTSMVIPEGVQKVSYRLFAGCDNLKSVVIPSSISSISYSAFYDCSRLTDVYYAKGELSWIALAGNIFSSSVKIHFNSTGPAREYTVFFDTNGGTMTADGAKTVTQGKTYGTLPTPKRSGYTFKGWYTKASGGTKVSSTTKVNLTTDQTLYAQWTKNSATTTQCKITLDANGGKVTPASISVAKNSTYLDKLPTPTRSGYTFKGWYTTKNGSTKITASTKATVSRKIYAQWTKSSAATNFTIKLNANGGKVTPASISVAKNSTYLDKLPTPTRSGYIFKGWYTTKNGSTKITASTKATVSRTIYAQWTKDVAKQYTVFFDPIDGEVDTEELVVTNGKTYGNLPTPTRAGYTFNGWYTEETGGTRIVNTTTVNLTGDQILYAQWTKGSTAANCTIKLNANGGKVTPASISVAKNSTYFDQLPTPERTGYTFKGWYTTKTGSTKITASTKATVSRTIYAQWTEDAGETYTVTFDPTGGRVHQREKLVTSGDTYQALPTPSRDGYHFAGWYTSQAGGVKITEQTRVTLTGGQTLYAHWTTSPVTVKSMESGNWVIRFPANYDFFVYDSESAADASIEMGHSSEADIHCTRRAELSNGTVRYYGRFGDDRWFTYTCEMEIQ